MTVPIWLCVVVGTFAALGLLLVGGVLCCAYAEWMDMRRLKKTLKAVKP